jgi:Ser-tRNA(Ala) deacylase AlaX
MVQAYRRWDEDERMRKETDPRMHSAEHVLNQTMVRLFDCGRCFSAHIEKKKSKCDYYFDRPLTETEVAQIETQVNDVIQADLPITEHYMTRQESAHHFDLHRLPQDAGEPIRIVRVGDYDACPCIGPHVKSTKEIGEFRVGSVRFEQGVLRIRFKLGKNPAR